MQIVQPNSLLGLRRHFPCNRVSWHDVKGCMVIEGTYEEAVKMMGDISFLSALMNFPKESINEETVELLQPYFAAPDFNYEAAKKASGCTKWRQKFCSVVQQCVLQPWLTRPTLTLTFGCEQASGNVAGLCNWAEAMCTYHAVEKDVAPKIARLREAEAELRVAEREKGAAVQQLATVQASLDDMQARFPIQLTLPSMEAPAGRLHALFVLLSCQ